MSDKKELSYTWNIEGELFNKVVKAKNGEVFKSETFKIDGLKWRIEICPNGYKPGQLGSFQIYVKLITLPKLWKSITVSRSIKCPQTQSGITVLAAYNKSGHSRGWAADTLRLKEITDLKLLSKKLSITVRTKILQIISKKHGKVLYQSKVRSANYKQSLLNWKLDQKQFRFVQRAYNGKCITSEVFDGMWALKLLPNGSSGKKEEKGQCMIGLQLCTLLGGAHAQIAAFDMEVNIRIKQLKINKTETKKYECLQGSQWLSVCSFRQLRKCKDLQIIVHILIRKEYGPGQSGKAPKKMVKKVVSKPKPKPRPKSKPKAISNGQKKSVKRVRKSVFQPKIEKKVLFDTPKTVSKSIQRRSESSESETQKMIERNENKLREMEYEMSLYNTKFKTYSSMIDKNMSQMAQTMEIVQSIHSELEQTQSQQRQSFNPSKNNSNSKKAFEKHKKEMNSKLSLFDKKFDKFGANINQKMAKMQKSVTEKNSKFEREIEKKLANLSRKLEETRMESKENAPTALQKLRTFFESELQMPQYLDAVLESGFADIPSLYDLLYQDLKEMNVKVAHRNKMLRIIKQKQESSQ